MNNFVQPGQVVDMGLPADVVSGEVVAKGNLQGVAAVAGATGDVAAVKVDGVFDFAKGAQAFSQGDSVYYDGVLKEATDNSNEKFLGICFKDAAVGDDSVHVDISANAVAAQLVEKHNALLRKMDLDPDLAAVDWFATAGI